MFIEILFMAPIDMFSRLNILAQLWLNLSTVDREMRFINVIFSGELIENFGLKLIDYGFIYHRDRFAPQDDMHWFLLEK